MPPAIIIVLIALSKNSHYRSSMKQVDNPQISLKKQPKQERSKLLVSSIYDATARILERFGIDGTTTNRIAETTGISVGSLYQYFPNKDSIFTRLIERVETDMDEWWQTELEKNKDETFEKAIENITHAMVDRLMDNKKFLKPLFLEVPRLKQTQTIINSRQKKISYLVTFAMKHIEGIDRAELEKRVWVLGHATMGVFQTSIFGEEEYLTRDELKSQLTKLSQSFLLNP